MEKQIKPIETQYAGRKFRSRLEARWAAYFDGLGITWDYEPEGFVLPSGECYLPDFYFPTYKCYGEIKPSNFEEDKRHEEFVKHGEYPLLLFIGTPGQYPNEIYKKTEKGAVNVHDGYAFADVIWGKDYLFHWDGDSLPETNGQMNEFLYALHEANTIRFEHGETKRVESYAKSLSNHKKWDRLRAEFKKLGNLNAYRALK